MGWPVAPERIVPRTWSYFRNSWTMSGSPPPPPRAGGRSSAKYAIFGLGQAWLRPYSGFADSTY